MNEVASHHLPVLVELAASGGVTTQSILDAAARRHLTGRVMRIEVADLVLLEASAILQWSFAHFVVFERFDVRERLVYIVDPVVGRRRITLHEASRYFGGIAIVFDAESRSRLRSCSKRARDTRSRVRPILAAAAPVTPPKPAAPEPTQLIDLGAAPFQGTPPPAAKPSEPRSMGGDYATFARVFGLPSEEERTESDIPAPEAREA